MPGGVHPNMRRWTPNEDARLIRLIGEYNFTWSKMKHEFDSRTAAQLRSRYKRIESGQAHQQTMKAKNKCSVCHQLTAGHQCTGVPAADVNATAAKAQYSRQQRSQKWNRPMVNMPINLSAYKQPMPALDILRANGVEGQDYLNSNSLAESEETISESRYKQDSASESRSNQVLPTDAEMHMFIMCQGIV